jgi:CRISPR/Cas system-associated exonuclease Cas4 (RecB family)
MSSGKAEYASASELADYAYCPRSHWYRAHPPPGGPSDVSVRRAAAGERAHRRQLSGERRRAAHRGSYWVLLLVGLLVVALGCVWLL